MFSWRRRWISRDLGEASNVPSDFVIAAIQELPTDASVERIRDEAELALKLREAMDSAVRGDTISHEELVRETQTWTATSTR